MVTLGALLADTPHTRPIPVSGTADASPTIADRLKLEQSNYEGPTGIVGVFQDAARQADIPSVSFWAAVPHYVAAAAVPKATLALLGQLEDLLEVSIPLGDLPEEARAWERGVDELAEEDEEVARLRPLARGDPGHRRPARGQRRGDRARVRALPAPPRRRGTRRRPLTGAVSGGTPSSASQARPTERPERPVGAARRARDRLDPGVDRRQRAGRVEVVGERGADVVDRSVGVGAAVGRQRRAPAWSSRSCGSPSTSSVHSHRCGSGARAGPAGSPSGRRRPSRSRETRTRLPLDLLIFSPSKPTIAWWT